MFGWAVSRTPQRPHLSIMNYSLFIISLTVTLCSSKFIITHFVQDTILQKKCYLYLVYNWLDREKLSYDFFFFYYWLINLKYTFPSTFFSYWSWNIYMRFINFLHRISVRHLCSALISIRFIPERIEGKNTSHWLLDSFKGRGPQIKFQEFLCFFPE